MAFLKAKPILYCLTSTFCFIKYISWPHINESLLLNAVEIYQQRLVYKNKNNARAILIKSLIVALEILHTALNEFLNLTHKFYTLKKGKWFTLDILNVIHS